MPAPRVSGRVVGMAIAGVGLVMILVSAWRLNRAYDLANGQEVTARVVSNDPEAGTVTVRFNDLKGNKREPTFQLGKAKAARHPKGARLELVYLQADSSVCVLKGDGPTASSVVVWFALGIAVAGLGAILAIREPRKPPA